MYGQEKMQEDLDMALVEEMMFSEEGTTLAAAPDTVSLLRAEPLPAPAAPPVVGNGPRGREERGKRGGERGEAGWGVREVERGGKEKKEEGGEEREEERGEKGGEGQVDYLDVLGNLTTDAESMDLAIVELHRAHRARMSAHASERKREELGQRLRLRRWRTMKADLGMAEDASAAGGSDSGSALARNAQGAGSDMESELSEGEDEAGIDACCGLRLDPPRPLEELEMLKEHSGDWASVNISKVEVTKQDALAIERLYPFKPGVQYVLPSRVAFARDQLRRQEAKQVQILITYSSIEPLHMKCTRALTFTNLCQKKRGSPWSFGS